MDAIDNDLYWKLHVYEWIRKKKSLQHLNKASFYIHVFGLKVRGQIVITVFIVFYVFTAWITAIITQDHQVKTYGSAIKCGLSLSLKLRHLIYFNTVS